MNHADLRTTDRGRGGSEGYVRITAQDLAAVHRDRLLRVLAVVREGLASIPGVLGDKVWAALVRLEDARWRALLERRGGSL